MKPEQQSLVVALRVRPMNKAEIDAQATEVARTVDKNLVVLLDTTHDGPDDVLRANRSKERTYAYDVAFGPESTQTEVYEQTTRALIDSVTAGYHATAFAYGPTGAGKTYTMLGTDAEPGIVVLTLNDLFQRMENTKEEVIYRTTIAYLEVYNEMIRDLLHPSSGCLELREDANGEAIVTGLVEVEANSAREVLHLVRLGSQRRTCEPTAVNKTSSRSHAILKLTLEQRSRVMDITQEVKTGVLYMVDLAGSERAAVTKNRGKRMIEGAHINRSLLALGNCINTLGGVNYKGQFVNYRDSKLTRLLKDSLAGSRRTTMIAHISPASTSVEESRNTLNYAERAKHIKVKPHQNIKDVSYHITQYHQIIAELRGKIEHLQGQLLTAKSEKTVETKQESKSMDESCTQLKAILTKEKAILVEEKELQQELLGVECALLQNALECQKCISALKEWNMKKSTSLASLSMHNNSMQSPTTTATTADHMMSPDHVSSDHLMSFDDHELCTSPDIVAELLGVPLEPMGVPLQPMDISSCREELATLAADKQRLEAQQKRLQKKLKANKTAMSDLQQHLSDQSMLEPLHKDMLEVMVRARQLEETSAEQTLTAMVAGVQLGQRRAAIEELVRQNTLLLKLIERQRSLMNEGKVHIPLDVDTEYMDLCMRHRSIITQMAIEKGLSPIKRVELPSLADMSAHVFTTTSGSKSNLLLDEGAPDSREHSPVLALSDIKLPSMLDGSFTFEPAHLMAPPPSLLPNAMSSPAPHRPLTTTLAKEATPIASDVQSPLPHPPQSTAEATPTEALVERTLVSSKKAGLLSKVASFTPPYIAIPRCPSNKYRVRKSKGEGKAPPSPLPPAGVPNGVGRRKAKKETRRRAVTFPPLAQPHKTTVTFPPLAQPQRTTLTLNELESLTKPLSNKITATRKGISSPIGGRLRKKPPSKTTKPLHKVNVGAFMSGSPYLAGGVRQSHKKTA